MGCNKTARATIRRRKRLVILGTVIAVGIAVIFVVRPGGGHSADVHTAFSRSASNPESAVSPPIDSGPNPGPSGRQSAPRASDNAQGWPGNLPPLDERGDTNGDATVFDDTSPSTANLTPDLRDAFRRAALDAEKDGVRFYVTSGWRSAAHQQRLLNQAIAEYGSEAEALKWVATPQTSPHVRGEAMDIGHDSAIAWLSKRGASYDLCQIYRNEPWHYELRLGAADHGCPAMYADPTHDPRMQN